MRTVSPFRAEQGTSLETPSRSLGQEDPVEKEMATQRFSHVCLLVSLWTLACQAPLSMDSSGKNTGVGCHCLPKWQVCSQDQPEKPNKRSTGQTCFSAINNRLLPYRGKRKHRSPLESRRGSLGAPERPQGSPASSSFWRVIHY